MALARFLMHPVRRFHFTVCVRNSAESDSSETFRLPDEAQKEFYNIADKYRSHPIVPDRGHISDYKPVKVKVKKGQSLMWCNCGYSGLQPYCNGSHKLVQFNTKLRPVRYIADADKEIWLCMCKRTQHPPFCDGSHKNLEVPASRV